MKLHAAFALAFAAAALAGCGGGDDSPIATVTYSANGPAPLEVTYSAGGQMVHEQAASGSFSRDVPAVEGDELFVSAQSPQQLTFVTASITVDGTLLKAGAARGQAIATAVCCRLP
jgi:hypothetical protein